MKKQQEKHDKLQKEVNYLNKQKQEISTQYQIAISFINTISTKISYCKGFMDNYKKDLDNKLFYLPDYHLCLFLIHIVIQEKKMKMVIK